MHALAYDFFIKWLIVNISRCCRDVAARNRKFAIYKYKHTRVLAPTFKIFLWIRRQNLPCIKLQNSGIKLLFSENRMILASAVLSQHTGVRRRQTKTHWQYRKLQCSCNVGIWLRVRVELKNPALFYVAVFQWQSSAIYAQFELLQYHLVLILDTG